jgi:hypothetical protein
MMDAGVACLMEVIVGPVARAGFPIPGLGRRFGLSIIWVHVSRDRKETTASLV